MTIGSPSGSGATQNDIADGVDESVGRWMTFYDGALTATQPNQIAIGGSGAVPTFEGNAAQMEDGSSGSTGFISTSGNHPLPNNNGGEPQLRLNSGSLFVKVIYASKVSIANLADDHFIGIVNTVDFNDSDNCAYFRPHIGDNTSGNVRVDNNGTDNDGSLSYPTINRQAHSFAVLADYDGNYLSAGETGFYVDADPRRGDSPDVTISAVPDLDNSNLTTGRSYGVAYNSNGNFHTLITNHVETGLRI